MNNEERTNFWNVLLKAKHSEDAQKLLTTIKSPKYVYRYRSAEGASISNIGKNKMLFSTSIYYDDPFDTFIYINLDIIKAVASALKNESLPEELLFINEELRLLVDKAKGSDLTKVTENVINYLKDFRNDMRKNTWSICFCESFDNESLWLKYANGHKGFLLEYDVRQLIESKIKVDKDAYYSTCDNCESNVLSSKIWPVYYSKEKYDATFYAGFCAVCKLLEQCGQVGVVQQMVSKGLFKWYAERVILTKKWIHHFDEEWRLLLNTKYRIQTGCRPYIRCKPSRIIFGLNLTNEQQQRILLQAKKAGVECCQKMIINNADEFVLDEVNLLKI